VPLFAELALAIGMGLVGTLLAARQGDAQAAAFAVCSQVLAMLFVFFRTVGAGVSVVVAQALTWCCCSRPAWGWRPRSWSAIWSARAACTSRTGWCAGCWAAGC